jgi:Holliday junction resolvasome RuvABC endonuclease subunit
MSSVLVLGIDPGLATFGLTVVQLTPTEEVVQAMHIKTTEKSPKKQNVKAADDTLRRSRELSEWLEKVVGVWGDQIKAICVEAMSWPRNSAAAVKVAMSWGVLSSLSARRSWPVVMATPAEIKLAVCGVKSASKQQVQDKLMERYPHSEELQSFRQTTAKTKQEHGFDALGSVVACLDSEVIRLARRFAS